jgi:hypothetical protein
LLPPKEKTGFDPFSVYTVMADLQPIIDKLQLENDKKAAANPMVKKSLAIVKEFLQTHPVMCYGGTAINNLLPETERFYDPVTTIPDYDFYSKTPQEHAMLLANKLAEAGVESVEAKPGMHLGTFKVFADYEGVADITHLDEDIFERNWKENVVRDGIHYVTPDFLRLSMYLELSRPKGDVSRWTKVYDRLQLLNKYHPMVCPADAPTRKETSLDEAQRKEVERILETKPVVLLGITASQIHQGRTPKWTTPVTLLAEEETLKQLIEGKTTETHKGSEILPGHVDVLDDDGDVVLRIHETAACHSYHQMANGVRVASIPTMLQFFFAYMYSGVDKDELTHLLCVSQRLVDLASRKEARRYALLTPIECIGTQETLLDMKRHKAQLYLELSKNRNSVDFLKYFFSYNPRDTDTKRAQVRKALKKTRRARTESSY